MYTASNTHHRDPLAALRIIEEQVTNHVTLNAETGTFHLSAEPFTDYAKVRLCIFEGHVDCGWDYRLLYLTRALFEIGQQVPHVSLAIDDVYMSCADDDGQWDKDGSRCAVIDFTLSLPH